MLVGNYAAHAQALFEDEFNGAQINTSQWDVHDNNWFIGRTRFGNTPQLLTENGTSFARLMLDSYNPQRPGMAFRGTEMWSRQQFVLANGVEYTARMRANNVPSGAVLAFFTYRQRDFGNDFDQEEIDFELLTKQANNAVWLNSWKGVGNDDSILATANFNRNNWHVYKIRWLHDKIEWLIDDVLVRTTSSRGIDDRMSVCFNMWVAESDWPQAYDAPLSPVSNSSQNTAASFDVDYIKVNRPAPLAGAQVGTGTGLSGVFFDNADFTNPKTTQLSPTLNFNWQAGSPHRDIHADSWSARWTGQLQAQVSQTYTFTAQSDDGVKLWLNNQLLIDRSSPGNSQVNVDLVAGQKYDIKAEYIEGIGDAALRLWWSSPSTPLQLIPPTQLYPATPEAVFLPEINIVSPTHTYSYTSPPFVSGTASDASISGLQSVTLKLGRYSDNRFWDGDSWETTATQLPVVGMADWRFDLPALPDGKYFVQATATDNGGRSKETSAVDFYLDRIAPTIVIETPRLAERSVVQATGTCIDSGPGTAEVKVQLLRRIDNQYWNGTSWQNTAVLLNANLNDARTNWSLAMPSLTDGKYLLTVQSRDWVGNPSQVEREFTIDNVTPNLAVTTPTSNSWHGNLQGNPAQVNGTAFDAGSGVSTVQVSIFSYATSQTSMVTVSGATSAPGTTPIAWTGSMPSLANGQYRMQATAADGAGNETTVTFNFQYDKTIPIVSITQPQDMATYSALNQINGTAQDTGSGVKQVGVLLQRLSDNLYWNGTGWVMGPISPVMAQGTTSWTFPINTTWTNGPYRCQVRAVDNVDNLGVTTAQFTIDASQPTITLVDPQVIPSLNARVTNNPQTRGTAGDNGGQIQSVRGQIQRSSDNLYWTGNSWIAAAPTLTATGTSNWTLALPDADGTYNVTIWSVDNVGNTSPLLQYSVTVDKTAPATTIQTPVNGGVQSTLTQVTGTSNDNLSGVQNVRFSLRRLSDNLYWDGTQWNNSEAQLDALPGNLQLSYNWSRTNELPQGENLLPGQYEIIAWANDVVNNTSSSSPVTFSIAAPPPTPTATPIVTPTIEPTVVPTVTPTVTPTIEPTVTPTATPTAEPTATPTEEPTVTPTPITPEPPVDTPTPTPLPDRTPPTVLWTTPKVGTVVNRLAAVAGVAVDNQGGSGVERIDVMIQRNSDRRYWNGRVWGTVATRIPATWKGRSWVLLQSTLSGANLPSGIYTLATIATDKAGNRATSVLAVFVDTVGPAITIIAPRGTADPRGVPLPLTDLASISGRAVDPGVTQRVQLVLQRTTDYKYWSGTAWVSAATLFPAVVSGHNWARNSSLPRGALLPSGVYRLTVYAFDRMNNRTIAHWRFSILRPVTTSTTRSGTSGAPQALLSSPQIDASQARISLQFATALEANSAIGAANYRVQIGGIEVPVEMVKLESSTRVVLHIAPDDWQSGSLQVQWTNLRDASQRTLAPGEWSGAIP
jgi:hypothetical protein